MSVPSTPRARAGRPVSAIAPILLVATWALATVWASAGCGRVGDVPTVPSASESSIRSGSTLSTGGAAEISVEALRAAWRESVAAVEGAGPLRVVVVETAEFEITDPDVSPSEAGPITVRTEAEQLLDPVNGRARLTVTEEDGGVEITVVDGRERSTMHVRGSPSTESLSGIARYVSLEPRAGLPLPLWAGRAAPGGIDDRYSGLPEPERPVGEDVPEVTRPLVEELATGGRRLSWEWVSEESRVVWTALLDPDRLPVRITTEGDGVAGGDLEGLRVRSAAVLEYRFERRGPLSRAEVTLAEPDSWWRRSLTYELPRDRPWSEHASWGQYWLGPTIDGWELVRAEHVASEDDPALGAGAEPPDDSILLIYDRPRAPSDNQGIQVTIRRLDSREAGEERLRAEEGVRAGRLVSQIRAVSGREAVVYATRLEGGPGSRIESLTVFLPDALVSVALWAPIDPALVLDALRAVE